MYTVWYMFGSAGIKDLKDSNLDLHCLHRHLYWSEELKGLREIDTPTGEVTIKIVLNPAHPNTPSKRWSTSFRVEPLSGGTEWPNRKPQKLSPL